MSDWNLNGTSSDDWSNESNQTKSAPTPGSGGWHASMTFVSLLVVGLCSFAMAYATSTVPSRPAWLLSLIFAVPVIALMISVLLIEKVTCAMTPRVSRTYQVLFAAGTVLLAAAIGFFCQQTNVESHVAKQGWSNAIIILDKSGSMASSSKDTSASSAVQKLLEQMDDDTQVGLVIDRGGTIYGSTSVAIAPLSQNRSVIANAVTKSADGGTDFQWAVETAAAMAKNQYGGDLTALNIIMVTDGQDSINTSALQSYFVANGITFSYLRIGAKENNQLATMVTATNGMSVDVSGGQELLDSMKTITQTEVTVYDALRDIGMSNQAKIVVGILMLLLGILIGIALTVMFSVQGQKRFQLILSPLMAVLSFSLLAFGSDILPNTILREGLAFTLIGLVLMKKNRTGKAPAVASQTPASSGGASASAGMDENW